MLVKEAEAREATAMLVATAVVGLGGGGSMCRSTDQGRRKRRSSHSSIHKAWTTYKA